MEKKEYLLSEEDFNYGMILANTKPLIPQLVKGKFEWVKTELIADQFWDNMAAKYGFIRETLEVNLPDRDGRYFLAVPDEDELSVYCYLCKGKSGPAHHSGCDKDTQPGCAWYNTRPQTIEVQPLPSQIEIERQAFLRVLEWDNEGRKKPSNIAFTAGLERTMAVLLETCYPK